MLDLDAAPNTSNHPSIRKEPLRILESRLGLRVSIFKNDLGCNKRKISCFEFCALLRSATLELGDESELDGLFGYFAGSGEPARNAIG